MGVGIMEGPVLYQREKGLRGRRAAHHLPGVIVDVLEEAVIPGTALGNKRFTHIKPPVQKRANRRFYRLKKSVQPSERSLYPAHRSIYLDKNFIYLANYSVYPAENSREPDKFAGSFAEKGINMP
jgi:hypothetical protein